MLYHRRAAYLCNCVTNTVNHIEEGLVSTLPECHRSAIRGKVLQMRKRGILPVYWTQEDGDDICQSLFVPIQGKLHFIAVAVVGGYEVRADQQENNGSFFQVGI